MKKLRDLTMGELRKFCVEHACGECPFKAEGPRGHVFCQLGTPPVEVEEHVLETGVPNV